MEKLGVDQGQDDLTKQGSADVLCPECNTKVEKVGTILKCPVHGTKPFEKKPKVEDKE